MDAPPVTSSTVPSVSIVARAPSDGRRPLSSKKMLMPMPTVSPALPPAGDLLLQRLELHGFKRLLQKRRIIAGIENLSFDMGLIEFAAVRHLPWPDQVAPPDFNPVDPELLGPPHPAGARARMSLHTRPAPDRSPPVSCWSA